MPRNRKVFISLASLLILMGGLVSFSYSAQDKSIATGKAKKNALYLHASPYLDMHGRDPVRWQEWNDKTLQQARKQNKMLFVSSGYFSCHWCHVMQRESYQNNDIAKLLNKHFIPVKVDRELNSALDSLLIDFTERTQGSAGWPLNVFITPEGYPLVGMTYVPAENMLKILGLMHSQWEVESEQVKSIARAASIELSTAELARSTNISKKWLNEITTIFINQSLGSADDMQGGYGDQHKFPNVPKLLGLIDIYAKNRSNALGENSDYINTQIKEFLILTLNKMASQGLRDQLGGGFYRYTVDPGWQVPHFEKMLYDNALLAHLYFRAAKVLERDDYKTVARQTLDFILHDLDTPSAAFAASLSAVDNKGIEGGYYLWRGDELKKYLNAKEFSLLSQYWGTDGAPDLDDGHHFIETIDISQLARQSGMSLDVVQKNIASARKKLLKVRAKRNLPKDEKVLTAWNALTLTALVAGAEHDKKYKHDAGKLVQYFKSKLWDAKRKVLYRAQGNSGHLGPGTLEDYAYTAQALLAWWQLDGHSDDKKLIKQILGQAWQRFYGKQGWILAENMLLKYGSGKTMVSDGPLPSPSSVLIDSTYKFAQLTNNKELKSMALGALNVGDNHLRKEGYFYASQLSALLNVELDD